MMIKILVFNTDCRLGHNGWQIREFYEGAILAGVDFVELLAIAVADVSSKRKILGGKHARRREPAENVKINKYNNRGKTKGGSTKNKPPMANEKEDGVKPLEEGSKGHALVNGLYTN